MNKKARGAFVRQRSRAAVRGIEFKLTFEEWWNVWKQSGRWCQRGIYKNQYCMARFGDCGAYEIGNVKIITAKQNRAEQVYGKTTREKMRFAKLGRKISKAHAKKLHDAWRGQKHKPSTIARMREIALARSVA